MLRIKLFPCLGYFPGVDEIPTAIGISEKTAYAWLKLPHVTTAYHEAQQQIFDVLMLDTTDARLTLRAIMQDTSAPHGNRVRDPDPGGAKY